MPTQLLATRLAVTNLAAGATTSIPHGLKSDGKGVTPTLIVCDRSSPIAVTGYDTLVVTFTNVGDVMASAYFRVEYDHSIHAIGTPTVAWQGWNGEAVPAGPAGGDLAGTYPDPTVVGLNTYPLDLTAPVNGDYLRFDGTSCGLSWSCDKSSWVALATALGFVTNCGPPFEAGPWDGANVSGSAGPAGCAANSCPTLNGIWVFE